MKKIFKDAIVMILAAYSQQFLRQSYDFWIIIMASGISAVVEQSTRVPKFKSSNQG